MFKLQHVNVKVTKPDRAAIQQQQYRRSRQLHLQEERRVITNEFGE